MENPYTILEINKNASKDEITKAYHKLAKKWHPDKNKSPEANEMFKKINDAHNYLIDDTKREFFNKFGKRMDDENQENGGGNPFGPGGFPFGAGGFPFGPGHGAGFPFGPGASFMNFQMGPNPEQIKEMKRKQLHIKLNIELNLEQIYQGVKKTIKYPRVRVINDIQKQEEGEIDIDIKPGFHYNSQIEIKNKGHIIEENGSEIIGSIIIIISEKKNDIFERDPKKQENLIYIHKITFIEALCGFSLELQHPSGKTLFIESNEIINGSSQYKIINKGLPIFNNGKMYGDIIFDFEIIYPNKITEEEKEKLSTLFNHKIKECSKPNSDIITGNLILYEHTEDEDNNDNDNHNNFQQGQSVQCAQS